jgi:octaprenyl-diphosphate synthase
MANSIPRSGIPAFRLIDDQLSRVKELINEQLTAPAPASGSPAGVKASARKGRAKDIDRLLEYVSSRSGKMIRPGLVLLSYRVVQPAPAEAFSETSDASCEKGLTAENAESAENRLTRQTNGGLKLKNPANSVDSAVKENECSTQHDIRNTQYEAIRVAAIVEMIHDATLLHDDVIDEGQRRRGQPTINSLWGNESAVLLGDFLLSRVFKMCAELEPREARVIAAAAIRICEGELRQIVQKRNWQLSESEYIDIITEKSAALFSSCCYLGGLLAQGTEKQVQSLAAFGLNVGIAFQITDDLLDIVGDESKTGKTLGRDADKNKLTLAVIHLLRAVDEEEKSAVIDSYLERKNTQYDKPALVEMLSRYGSLEYARNRAQEFVAAAVRALAGLQESDAKKALIETAKFMASRAI